MDLPGEMVMEILAMLPSRSVIRFKSVCKPWCSVLSTARFMTKHLLPDGLDDGNLLMVKHRHKTSRDHVLSWLSGHTLAVAEHNLVPPPFPGASKEELWNLEILGSCCLGGLVCIHYQARFPHVALWNIATGDVKYLPPSDVPDRPGSTYFNLYDEIAYGDNAHLKTCRASEFGFGYDADSQGYKVIRVTQDVTTGGSKVEIYSAKSNTWRGQHRDLPGGASILPSSSHYGRAYANGIFLWRAALPLPDGESDFYLWFRMSDESFGLFRFPRTLSEETGYASALVLNGRVSFMTYDYDYGYEPVIHRCFHVWVLLEFGVTDSWTRLFTIGPFVGIERPLRFCNNGQMIMETSDGRLVLVDPFSQEIKPLDIHGYPVGLETQIVSVPAGYIS